MTNQKDKWSRLMAESLDGDQRAYDRLLREIVPVIARFVQSRWPSVQKADVDDIVQETLRSLHAVRHTYGVGRPFLPWMLAIAQHRLLDHRRVLRRRQTREDAIETVGETFLAVTTNTRYEPPVAHDALGKAIAGLPPRQRLAIQLLGLKELSLKEAAAQSGLSVATLKVASHRGIKALRKALGGYG